jgi:hypothetical protein
LWQRHTKNKNHYKPNTATKNKPKANRQPNETTPKNRPKTNKKQNQKPPLHHHQKPNKNKIASCLKSLVEWGFPGYFLFISFSALGSLSPFL